MKIEVNQFSKTFCKSEFRNLEVMVLSPDSQTWSSVFLSPHELLREEGGTMSWKYLNIIF
jgi:hypothetical protein